MSLDSAMFILCFLPILALLYFALRRDPVRNYLLLIAGLFFYAFGSLTGLLLLLLSAVINYAFGLLLICKSGKEKITAAIAVILNLAFLISFKYLSFLLSFLTPLIEIDWKATSLSVPVGISFFTFKCISYIIDTYRDKRNGTRSFFTLLLYISFFPQIMAGPITRFRDFRPQLDHRKSGAASLARGLRRFIIGLGKKLILAGAAARVVDPVFAAGSALDTRLAWIGAIAYMLQIYFDFSGYSDMAIGLGCMFGFETPENFNYPYIAGSVTEFWRRWHISLSLWFRDYLYIPLGGNRRGRAREAFNKLVVFALCGLWHGAAWTFVLWGVWHGLFSAIESLIDINKSRIGAFGRAMGHIYTLLVVCVGFVFFRADSLMDGWRILSAMFGAFPITTASTVTLRSMLTLLNACLLLLGAVLTIPIKNVFLQSSVMQSRGIQAGSYALCMLLLVICLMELAAGGFAPFIYFQF